MGGVMFVIGVGLLVYVFGDLWVGIGWCYC